ncbi:MAG TPA: hypothetical protein VGW12_12675 [Pyrinomonadaceae bacterium]|nr:hypothetical protein [Pyrinomonadaceae bacterium]
MSRNLTYSRLPGIFACATTLVNFNVRAPPEVIIGDLSTNCELTNLSNETLMRRNFSWRPGLLAAVAMMLLALLPQAHLCYTRGDAWQGAYASFDGDETAYAAYLAALIAGRPRLSDVYAGVDGRDDAPQPESLFSIQFVPAYALSVPARALRLDASTVFIALSPLVAFAATLAVFWLLALLLEGDARLAACGAIIILSLGALASGEASLAPLLKLRASHAYLSFLRRYVPALPFPLLFVFCALVWRALAHRRSSTRYAVGAGLLFALMVYSYFYLWTTAAAWLVCLALVWFLFTRTRDDRARAAKIFLTVAALACASLVPYALLLARRAPAMDKVQVLKFTHAPDLSRAPELVGLLALALLGAGVWRKRVAPHGASFLFAASFAITPLFVFNQQLLTGRSLQPVHYADYVLNYLSLVALTLAVALLGGARREADDTTPGRSSSTTTTQDTTQATQDRMPATERPATTAELEFETSNPALKRRVPARALLFFCVALAAYGWAAFELLATTRRFAPVNRARDEQARVAARLAEMVREGAGDAALVDASDTTRIRPVVFVTSFMLADNLPVGAPQASVLWSPHMHVFAGLTAEEHKERLFRFFYYTGVAPENFRAYLDANPLVAYTLFGAERVLPRLSDDYAPPTATEIEREAQAYAAYVASFTREHASRPALSFVITSTERAYDLSALERWYERDAGEPVGAYTIYRVRLRR